LGVESDYVEAYGWYGSMFCGDMLVLYVVPRAQWLAARPLLRLKECGRRYANLSVDKTAVYVNARSKSDSDDSDSDSNSSSKASDNSSKRLGR
jgi:hypothetical protein